MRWIKRKKADIVLIDEAHLLLTKEDHYNNFYYKNQLEEIIKRSKLQSSSLIQSKFCN